MTRRTLAGAHRDDWVPEQKITVEEVLTAYTKTNAFAFGEEDIAGTLALGKRADLVILSEGSRRVSPEALRSIEVVYINEE